MTAEEMLWEYGGDILRSPTMDQERTIPQHGSTTCYDHSVAVTLCSIRLAQKWGWDVDWRSLVRGALLHDYFLYNWREHNRDHKLHGFYHARKAMENAERDFGLNPVEANIIHRHMFPIFFDQMIDFNQNHFLLFPVSVSSLRKKCVQKGIIL